MKCSTKQKNKKYINTFQDENITKKRSTKASQNKHYFKKYLNEHLIKNHYIFYQTLNQI